MLEKHTLYHQSKHAVHGVNDLKSAFLEQFNLYENIKN